MHWKTFTRVRVWLIVNTSRSHKHFKTLERKTWSGSVFQTMIAIFLLHERPCSYRSFGPTIGRKTPVRRSWPADRCNWHRLPDTGTGTSADVFNLLAIRGPTRGEGMPGIEPGSSDPQSSPLPRLTVFNITLSSVVDQFMLLFELFTESIKYIKNMFVSGRPAYPYIRKKLFCVYSPMIDLNFWPVAQLFLRTI